MNIFLPIKPVVQTSVSLEIERSHSDFMNEKIAALALMSSRIEERFDEDVVIHYLAYDMKQQYGGAPASYVAEIRAHLDKIDP